MDVARIFDPISRIQAKSRLRNLVPILSHDLRNCTI